MSDQPTRWEWIQRILDPDGPQGATVRLTLLGLARHMDRSGGSCWPSIERLEAVTGLSDRTIRRSILEAESTGWIERVRMGRTYQYRTKTPVTVTGIQTTPNDSGNDSGGEEYRSQLPVSDDLTPVTATGIDENEHRSEIPVNDSIPVTVTGEYRSQLPVEGRKSTGEERVNRHPSLRSGGLELLKSEVNAPDADRALLVMAEAASHPPEWRYEHPVNGSEVIGWWIDLRRERPPDGDLKKQGAVAKRLASSHSRGDLLRAMIGIGSLFPHKEPRNEPWDLFDLEKKFTKAHDSFGNHPTVKDWKFRAQFKALTNGEQGNHHD